MLWLVPGPRRLSRPRYVLPSVALPPGRPGNSAQVAGYRFTASASAQIWSASSFPVADPGCRLGVPVDIGHNGCDVMSRDRSLNGRPHPKSIYSKPPASQPCQSRMLLQECRHYCRCCGYCTLHFLNVTALFDLRK